MEYKVKNKIELIDLWKVTLAIMYSSILVKVVNGTFSIAMILLAFKFWKNVGLGLKILLLFGALLFPLIQPLLMYGKAKKQLATIPQDMELVFNSRGKEKP